MTNRWNTYLFLFPFEIWAIPPGNPYPTYPLQRAGRRMLLYWPFRNKPGPRLIPSVNCAQVPGRKGPPSPFGGLPVPSLTPSPSRGEHLNGFRIDIEGAEAQPEAVAAMAHILRLIRWRTGQWWISHDHHDGERDLRMIISIDALGRADRSVSTVICIEPRRGRELPLTRELLAQVATELGTGIDVPLSRELLLDAFFFMAARDDDRRGTLEAAIAADTAVREHAVRIGCAKGWTPRSIQNKLNSSDMLYNIDRGIMKVAGRSFTAEQPQAAELLKALWIARGQLGHGIQVTQLSAARPNISLKPHEVDRFGAVPNRESLADMIEAVDALLQWLESL